MWKVGRYANNKFKPRVLICDQESHIRSVLQEYLSSVGFHTDQASNGNECIDLACMTHPDVILLDLDMPQMDGNTTVKRLRKMGINVPVILFSAGVAAVPFDDDSAILHKPFRPKEIAVILETLLLETKKEKRFIPRRFKIH
jgi:two-component system response regulator ResD